MIKKVPLSLFFQRFENFEDGGFYECWDGDSSELALEQVIEVRNSISKPIYYCAVWKGCVFLDGDFIENIEGEWRDVQSKYEEFVTKVLQEDVDRPDL